MSAIPYLAFFLSGASSLIFQALWTRMLHHTFGATSVATSTVLTAFMAGLGLGAYLFGRRAARLRRPLAVYALAELGVAAWALAIVPLVQSDGLLSGLDAALRHRLGEGSFGFMVARFLCVLPVLLVPTTLMGGTLPLLAQHFVRAGDREGTQGERAEPRVSASANRRVGTLYALNTFGAVAGTVLSSFVLMPTLGVRATNFVAAAINAALGLGILLFGRGAPPREPAGASEPAPPVVRGSRLALVAFGVSGACAMVYEVVWSRALAMAIGSSLQSFALILTTFLLGIAGGSAAAAELLGRARGLALLCALSMALCLLALAPALALSSAPLALTIWALLCLALGLFFQLTRAQARELARAAEELADPALAREARRLLARRGLQCLLVPCAIALFELARFALKRSALPAVAVHGNLPYVTTGALFGCALAFALPALFRRSPWLLAGAIQLQIALATFVSYLAQDEIPYGFARLVSSLGELPSRVGTVRFFMLLSAGLCTLPAALGMGAMFPVVLELWSGGERELSAKVGRVYAANTLGSILGAWLPGFVLLPLWGMEQTLSFGMGVNTCIALALLYAARQEHAPRMAVRALFALGAALLAGLVALAALPRSPLAWNLSHLTLGAFRVSLAREVLDPESWGQPDLVYYRDGLSTTVSVERWGRHLSLKNNGKVDASNGDDMPTQIMVAAYPLLLHPRGPRGLDVAIVGFGSGVTVGAALEFPLRQIDAIELEDAVVEAALTFFSDVSHLSKRLDRFPYLKEPRLRLHHDDGRNFLAATDRHYDVIISEPSNPWITGVSDLFTVEHFRISKRKLKPGGVYCQWVQLYELSPENIKIVYRTFASQFRYVLAFSAEELSSDTILVGSDSPLPVDLAHVARSLREPRVATELERAYIHSPYDLWSRILFASREEVLRFTQTEWRRASPGAGERVVMRATGSEPCAAPLCRRRPVELNSDDNMLIELRAPSDLIGFARYEGYLETFYGERWPYGDLSARLAHVEGKSAQLGLALSLLAHGRKRAARAFFARAGEAANHEPTSERELRIDRRTIALLLGQLPEPELAFEPPLPSLPLSSALRARFQRAYEQAERAFRAGDYGASAQALERLPLPLRTLSGPDLRFRYGLALYRGANGDRAQLKRAVLELEELIRRDELYARLHPELYYFLARALDAARSFDKAVRNMRTYAAVTLAE